MEDEVKRSARLHKPPGFELYELHEKAKPRKVKAKSATLLLQEELQHAKELCAQDGSMLPIALMQDLAMQYCELPPDEVTLQALNAQQINDD